MGTCRREQFNGASSEVFFFGGFGVRRDLLSFPTRRSSGRRFRLFLFFPAGRGVFGVQKGVGACRREQFEGASSEVNCFGVLRVRLQCIISGNSRLFGRRFHLFLFFPAGRGL